MLTTSPRIPNSANASPTAFHYAPTRSSSSPQSSSPSRLSASLARRHSGSRSSSHPTTSPSSLPQTKSPTPPASSTTSTTTASSSKQPPQKQTATTPCPRHSQSARPPQYVAVDAGTQYSPMEPVASAPSSSAAPGVVDMNATAIATAATAITASQTPIKSPPPAPQPKPIDPTKPENRPVIIEPEPSAPIVRQQTSDSVPSPGKRRKSRDDGAPALLDPSTGGGVGVGVAEGSNAPKRQRPAPPPQKVLPQRYELCSWEDMVVLIAHMLSELIETNDALALQSGNLTRFHSRTAPSISVLEYLSRLAKHATLTPPLLLSMVYYIDRLCALYPEFTINTLTVHRFLITAATVAAKGLSDSFWNNTTYARVGGVRVAELKLLELEFLYRVDWKIVPNPEVLVAYYRGLVERCPGYILEGEQPADEAEGDADEEGDSTDVSDEAAEHSDASDEKNVTSATGLSPRPGGGG